MCETCRALLSEALNLTVRGRTLDGIQRRSDCLNASSKPESRRASLKATAPRSRFSAASP